MRLLLLALLLAARPLLAEDAPAAGGPDDPKSLRGQKLLEGTKTPAAKGADGKPKFPKLATLENTKDVFWLLDYAYETPKEFVYEEPSTVAAQSGSPMILQDAPPAGGGEVRRYTYWLYTVTNNTGKTRDIAVDVGIEDDTRRSYHDAVHRNVQDAIEEKLGRPFHNTHDLIGPIEAGERKECIAVFEGIDPAFDRMQILVSGLTDEIETQIIEADGKKRTFVRHRVLKISYQRPGDEFMDQLDQTEPVTRAADGLFTPVEEWIWRDSGYAVPASEEGGG